jgi:hypothetical protein
MFQMELLSQHRVGQVFATPIRNCHLKGIIPLTDEPCKLEYPSIFCDTAISDSCPRNLRILITLLTRSKPES